MLASLGWWPRPWRTGSVKGSVHAAAGSAPAPHRHRDLVRRPATERRARPSEALDADRRTELLVRVVVKQRAPAPA